MKTSITNREMVLTSELRTFIIDNQEVTVDYQLYLCEDSGESFVTTDLDTENFNNIEKYLLKV